MEFQTIIAKYIKFIDLIDNFQPKKETSASNCIIQPEKIAQKKFKLPSNVKTSEIFK